MGASGEEVGPSPPAAVYHEQQVMSMCGVHCLNSLLQANAFTEVDLSQIAHELDRREREVSHSVVAALAHFAPSSLLRGRTSKRPSSTPEKRAND